LFIVNKTLLQHGVLVMCEERAAGVLLGPQPSLLNSKLNAHSNSLLPTQTPFAPVAQPDPVASFTGIAGSGAAHMFIQFANTTGFAPKAWALAKQSGCHGTVHRHAGDCLQVRLAN
jgi:hypothetical protein